MKAYIYIVIILILTIVYLYKYYQLKKLILPTDCNIVLRDIIELSFNKNTLEETTSSIIEVLVKKYKMDYCTILIKNRRGLTILSTNNKDTKHVPGLELYLNRVYEELELNKAEARILCSDNSLDYPTAAERNIKYMYFIPLTDKQQTIGAVLVENKSRENMEAIEKDIFKVVLDTITIVLQDQINKDKLSAAVYTDGLTGLLNRACMTKQLPELLHLHKSIDQPFSLVIMDIDHFKKVNDNYGHISGDNCLKQISSYIRQETRGDTDKIFRYGGEEILIFLNRTSSTDALRRVETIRNGITRLPIKSDTGQIFTVTASFGISEYPTNGDDIDTLIKKADSALYTAKKSGRNRTIVYSDKNL